MSVVALMMVTAPKPVMADALGKVFQALENRAGPIVLVAKVDNDHVGPFRVNGNLVHESVLGEMIGLCLQAGAAS